RPATAPGQRPRRLEPILFLVRFPLSLPYYSCPCRRPAPVLEHTGYFIFRGAPRADASLIRQIHRTPDDFLETLRIPGGLEPFAGDAFLVRVVLQQAHSQAA